MYRERNGVVLMAKKIFFGDIEIAKMTDIHEAAPEAVVLSDPRLDRFVNKSLIVSGDSLTEVNFRATKNWHAYLKDWLGFASVQNDGKSGTGFTRTYASFECMYDRMDDWSANYDYALIMASMNDGGGNNLELPLGTMADAATVGTSYYGDCKATITKLLNKYPLKQVGVISSIPRASSSIRGGVGYGLDGWYSDWCYALGDVCANYSVPFLDLYHTCNLRPWIASNDAEYFSCTQSPTGDGIHPNAAGQQIIAYKIYEFCKQYL